MKQTWKPGNMLYPIPAVLVSTRGTDGRDNLFTVGWTGTVCTNPPMLYISVRESRYSYRALHETGVFAVNLTTEQLCRATDYCGVVSGREHDKFRECHLTKAEGKKIPVSLVAESPVNIECRVVNEEKLGSHVMFLAEVVSVHVDESLLDENGKFHLEKARPIVYSHGTYFNLGQELGTFGYSVRKKRTGEKMPDARRKLLGSRKKMPVSRKRAVDDQKKSAEKNRKSRQNHNMEYRKRKTERENRNGMYNNSRRKKGDL